MARKGGETVFIPPMLLEKVKEPYNHPSYIFEPKLDGHRLILSYSEEATRLYTRHNTNVTFKYPELHINNKVPSMILDGEVCVLNNDGSDSFEQLMQRFALSDNKRIARSASNNPVTYFVFDILYFDGRDVRLLPLHERKGILKEAF